MSFSWSSTFLVGTATTFSQGDKIILPQTALESIIQAHASAPSSYPSDQTDSTYDPTSWENPPSYYNNNNISKKQDLPSPLTFQIRNPANRLLTHGGVREFSALDNQVHLPLWMMNSLSVSEGDQVMIKYLLLPKGTWAKFRPLTTDFFSEVLDLRALLEASLRSHYTTLTKGEILKVQQGNKEFEFLVGDLKPEHSAGQAVCITDTDLEVDIEPLETDMQQQHQHQQQQNSVIQNGKITQTNGMSTSLSHMMNSSRDRSLKIGFESHGEVVVDSYQCWSIDIPNRNSGIQITVNVVPPTTTAVSVDTEDLDVVVSTKAPVSLEDHIWANFESLNPRVITIPASDQEYSRKQEDGSQLIHIGLYGRASSTSSLTSEASSSSAMATAETVKGIVRYSIVVRYYDGESLSASSSSGATTNVQQQQEIPNKDAPGYQECTNCGSWIPERTIMLHTNFCLRNNAKCDRCGQVMKKDELPNHFHCDHCDKGSLASNARDMIRGLHSHESYCGDRTIQCQKCSAMVSLKDVQVHAQNHEFQRQNQPAPQLCSNQNCLRIKSSGGGNAGAGTASGGSNNILGLCQLCFGPFWIPTEDPKNQKLVQRLARKYHSQLMTGCGNSWCRNEYCASFRGQGLDATTAATELMGILKEAKVGASTTSYIQGGKTWLCVDEGATRKKVMAELLHQDLQAKYSIEWCIKALEMEKSDLEAASQWLNLHAPRKQK
ncbi:hypothetical protein BX616_008790 [Lobosporangium transversale]|uniref:Ubiquitin fusion degradation protein UFD1-domain-containing protein n=1 Tax=Lobosporangium transversale TaxID=64571 RepID=A0A1Y2H0V4_9FUNG|nr:ubiquitin fusion degradation protein UFD1-domain-containing protein [Lobosporangium transversale]KAF9914186.1 hypothetical protein BX616_008790 [Lobosporangium transversale]ORZ27353.1 ubiquitin fusion degradation protein UFD1-domain-containing protein [Lobosporangium transversale]|eukprot:XP_021885080.1 ubiquitin fusion degradation protein UFD1-domain-containing protein [Lobosporangium transversale]